MSPLNFNRYNKIVDHYAEAWIHLVPAYSQILSIMAEVIRARGLPPQSLLDLGCGTAKATESVAAVCAENAQVTLVDGASQMLDYAKTRLGSAVRNSILADFTDPAWADEIFLKDYSLWMGASIASKRAEKLYGLVSEIDTILPSFIGGYAGKKF